MRTSKTRGKEQASEYLENRTNPIHNLKDAYAIFTFFCSILYLFPLAVGFLLSRSIRLWAAAGIYCVAWGGLLLEGVKFPHYIAVAAGLLPVMVLYGLRWLRVLGGTRGPVLVLSFAALCVVQGKAPEIGKAFETRGRDSVSTQMVALRKIGQETGRQLIIVRYSPDHVDKSTGCVYNAADIDSAEVVWAEDMGTTKNQELIDYYHDNRKVWL